MGSGLISGAAAQFPKIGRFGVWRAALTWAVLIAFALQSYVTQTHVHHLPVPQIAGVSSSTVAAQAPAPADHEEIVCPLCQAIAAAGAFVGPAPIAIAFRTAAAGTAVQPIIVIGLAISTAGFSWRSRAPPQL